MVPLFFADKVTIHSGNAKAALQKESFSVRLPFFHQMPLEISKRLYYNRIEIILTGNHMRGGAIHGKTDLYDTEAAVFRNVLPFL